MIIEWFSRLFPGFLPIQGTEVARDWDLFYIFLIGVSTFFFVIVVGAMIVFAIKYRERPGHRPEYIAEHHLLEIVWTVIPTILVMVIFVWGWVVYQRMVTAPEDAMEVRVLGKQWSWQFQYDDGRVYSNQLFVPVNKAVKLVMTSEDVLHSFFVPNFRVKQDVVPGMYTTVWFEATVTGEHQVFCAEYCGAAHSGMLAMVIALEPSKWELFKKGKYEHPVAALDALGTSVGVQASLPGRKVAETKGCFACHSEDGSRKIGPSFKGVFGREESLADSSKIKVDEAYIRESLENPLAKVVAGFAPTMPPYKGQMSEQEIGDLLDYLKALK